MSGYSTGYDLVPANQQRNSAGEPTGTLCLKKHVFTAAEITAQSFTLGNPALESSQYTVVCYLNGNAHIPDVDFYVGYNSSSKMLSINWSSSSYNWYDNPPRADETAIFQYYKE